VEHTVTTGHLFVTVPVYIFCPLRRTTMCQMLSKRQPRPFLIEVVKPVTAARIRDILHMRWMEWLQHVREGPETHTREAMDV